jgi:N-formylglutamate amidohydrolase
VDPTFDVVEVEDSSPSLLATAVHAGHRLRPEIATRIALSEAERRREEDPCTERIAVAAATTFVARRSRFEVDLNRPRARAVYSGPDEAWGLEVWARPLPPDVIERSLRTYDEFYAALAVRLDRLARGGRFVVLDVHSYNHCRGPDRAPDDAARNPEVNVGTGSLDRSRWGEVAARFVTALGRVEVAGHLLDVRENVRFRGGHLADWVNDRYAGSGCALAIEFKKVFMDEWTGTVDDEHVDALGAALATAADELRAELVGS